MRGTESYDVPTRVRHVLEVEALARKCCDTRAFGRKAWAEYRHNAGTRQGRPRRRAREPHARLTANAARALGGPHQVARPGLKDLGELLDGRQRWSLQPTLELADVGPVSSASNPSSSCERTQALETRKDSTLRVSASALRLVPTRPFYGTRCGLGRGSACSRRAPSCKGARARR